MLNDSVGVKSVGMFCNIIMSQLDLTTSSNKAFAFSVFAFCRIFHYNTA